MLDGNEYFDCICHSPEHTLRFALDLDSDDPVIYTEIFLNQYRSWYKRIWIAIKYIFGYKCKYGHWDCWELKIEDAKRLSEMLVSYQIAHNESIRKLKLP
jgi:hypothetical protein